MALRSTVRKVLDPGLPPVTRPRRKPAASGKARASTGSANATTSGQNDNSAVPPNVPAGACPACGRAANTASTNGSGAVLPGAPNPVERDPASGSSVPNASLSLSSVLVTVNQAPLTPPATGNSAPGLGLSTITSTIDQAPSTPPPRRFPRNTGRLPLLKKNGARNGRAVLPTGVLSGRISKRFSPVLSTRPKGLKNPDITCYRNAALQCLLHVPAFYHYLGNTHKDCTRTGDRCVVCALQHLANVYWNEAGFRSDEDDEDSPPEIREEVVDNFNAACLRCLPQTQVTLREEFESNTMGDPHEFIEYLVTELEAAETADDQPRCAAMFEARSQEEWTCSECGYVRLLPAIQKPPGVGLEAWLPNMPKDTSLVQYLSNDTFQMRSQRRCDGAPCIAKYGGGSDVSMPEFPGPERAIRKTLTQLPEILVIRMMRFGYDQNYKPAKDDRQVEYQEYLNLGPYSSSDQEHYTYRLDGVVAHNGDSNDEGHYVAAVRRYDRAGFEIINDNEDIKETTKFVSMMDPVTSVMGGQETIFNPYVLVYSKL